MSSGTAPLVLAIERAWAIKALGRAGDRAALPLIRGVYAKPASAPEQLAAIMALGECGLPEDADLLAKSTFGGEWITGATAYVAAAHLAPERLAAMLALPGSIHWGAADAFMAWPCGQEMEDVLGQSSSNNWWVRWAMWKGTGRMDRAVVDAAIHARAARSAITPELQAVLARDGDDEALAALVSAMRANPGVFNDAGARRVEDVAQELAARLPPARQQRALARLRAGLDWGSVSDATLSMLRAQSSPALASELMAHWHEASANAGGAAPALLRALAQLRLDSARRFVVARLQEPGGAALCMRALRPEDLADPALRALLAPVMKGHDRDLAMALATFGMADYADSDSVSLAALRPSSNDLRRLRFNVPPTQGYLPECFVADLLEIFLRAADAGVRHECLDLHAEFCARALTITRTFAVQMAGLGMRDRDPGVAAFAKQCFAKLSHPGLWANQGDDAYTEPLVMRGWMSDLASIPFYDRQVEQVQRLSGGQEPGAATPPAVPRSGGAPATSNF